MAKIIVLDGGDGCGKATQANLLVNKLNHDDYNAHLLSFPNYQCESSSLVKMYLNGDFGNHSDIKPEVASLFFALDRYATLMKQWQHILDQNDSIIICDRYTTSNALYQMIRFEGRQQGQFIKWLHQMEYDLLEIPKPDLVVLLSLPIKVRAKLLNERTGKTGGKDTDIHESDINYLNKVDKAYNSLSKYYNCIKIKCNKGNDILAPDQIHSLIYEQLKESGILNG